MISSKPNSLFKRSVTISKCNIPKKPHLKPRPKEPEVSYSKEIEESKSNNLESDCLRLSKSS